MADIVKMVCVPSKDVTIYNNNKPWFNKEIKILWMEKHKAFKSGDKELTLKKLLKRQKEFISLR